MRTTKTYTARAAHGAGAEVHEPKFSDRQFPEACADNKKQGIGFNECGKGALCAECKFIKLLSCKVISALSMTCLVIWRREWDSFRKYPIINYILLILHCRECQEYRHSSPYRITTAHGLLGLRIPYRRKRTGSATNTQPCPIARGTNRRLSNHYDPAARHRSLPPGLCGTDMGLHWQHQSHRTARSPSRSTRGRSSRPTMTRRASRSAGRATSRSATTRSKSSAKKCATCTRTAKWPDRTKPAVRSSFQCGHA